MKSFHRKTWVSFYFFIYLIFIYFISLFSWKTFSNFWWGYFSLWKLLCGWFILKFVMDGNTVCYIITLTYIQNVSVRSIQVWKLIPYFLVREFIHDFAHSQGIVLAFSLKSQWKTIFLVKSGKTLFSSAVNPDQKIV